MKNLKPFDLQDALSGKAVMLRDGTKAYVRHHETELPVINHSRLTGFLMDGSQLRWCENGHYYGEDKLSDYDIIGMYPETRVINGFEVPAPETHEPKFREEYFIPSILNSELYERIQWHDLKCEHLWLKRGLVFLNKDDAIATAKAMLGIDPHSETES